MSKYKIGIVCFPGSHGAGELERVYQALGCSTELIDYRDEREPAIDLLAIPGGAAFGDYLRPGGLVRSTRAFGLVRRFASGGKFVVGVGNGAQILCECEVLPGAFLPNSDHRFMAREVFSRIESNETPFSSGLVLGERLETPISCSYGRYFLDRRAADEAEERGDILLRYCERDGEPPEFPFNGVTNNIAAIMNRSRNVLGTILRLERAADLLQENSLARRLLMPNVS